ncbi:putative Phytanoyl-CoA dioxygenase (PhyH)-containing protein 2, partial [Homarus americanus]
MGSSEVNRREGGGPGGRWRAGGKVEAGGGGGRREGGGREKVEGRERKTLSSPTTPPPERHTAMKEAPIKRFRQAEVTGFGVSGGQQLGQETATATPPTAPPQDVCMEPPGDDVTMCWSDARLWTPFEQAKKRLQHMYIEMKAGDMLFFHCNLFHCSEANTSDHRRWVFVVAFNKRSNDPYMEHHHPQYTPLKK